MSQLGITESVIEEAALNWLAELKYTIINGPTIAPSELLAERDSYDEVVLKGRLQDAINKLNPNIPSDAKEEAFRKIIIPDGPSLIANNRIFRVCSSNTEYF